ncbi:Beta-xylosidase [Alteromonadaceae bacterium Bs31]|nr:Beta-xylosidase [Alteromonadaceae bacterium Bs31]
MANHLKYSILFLCTLAISSCDNTDLPSASSIAREESRETPAPLPARHFKDQALVSHIYTADPSAHVFEGKLFIYPSHDIDTQSAPGAEGQHYNMEDYHVFSLETVGGAVTDHGPALHLGEVPWASKQMWAPDAAEKDGTYYLYFPAKDQHGLFRIGVATASKPQGPFKPLNEPIAGSYSIDPAVFKDDDGSYYLYLGGIRGGQLQHWQTGQYSAENSYPKDKSPTLLPRMAQLAEDMVSLAHPLTTIPILDENGNLINFGDKARMFFEAPWLHKFQGRYYLSWSTGEGHTIQYATADKPYGPFTWRGTILEPVLGWTTHHSIVKFQEKWFLLYHDTQLSGGIDHLRNIKMTELQHKQDGSIETIDAYLAD